MIKRTIITLILFTGISAALTAQIKIGYMNPQEALSEVPERQEVEQQMNQFINDKRNELEQRTAELQEQFAQYQNNSSSMSAEQRRNEEERLSELDQQLQDFRLNIQQQVERKRAELLDPLLERVDKAIADVAEELKLDFVLNEVTSGQNKIIFYASQEESQNITQRVIEKLNQN